MHLPILLSLLNLPTYSLASTSHLWATHYNGHIYTLTLNNNGLSITNKQQTCGTMPSWLTFDSDTRVLYCSDESGTADGSRPGSLTTYHADADGNLDEIASTETIAGGVNSVIYETEKKRKVIAVAH